MPSFIRKLVDPLHRRNRQQPTASSSSAAPTGSTSTGRPASGAVPPRASRSVTPPTSLSRDRSPSARRSTDSRMSANTLAGTTVIPPHLVRPPNMTPAQFWTVFRVRSTALQMGELDGDAFPGDLHFATPPTLAAPEDIPPAVRGYFGPEYQKGFNNGVRGQNAAPAPTQALQNIHVNQRQPRSTSRPSSRAPGASPHRARDGSQTRRSVSTGRTAYSASGIGRPT